jgi:transposase
MIPDNEKFAKVLCQINYKEPKQIEDFHKILISFKGGERPEYNRIEYSRLGDDFYIFYPKDAAIPFEDLIKKIVLDLKPLKHPASPEIAKLFLFLYSFIPKTFETAVQNFNKIYEEIEKCDVTQNIVFPMTHKEETRYRLGCFQFGKFDLDKFESRCKKSGSAPPGKLDLENKFSIERDYFESYVLNYSRIHHLRKWFPPEFPANEKFWNEYFAAIGRKLKINFWDTFADEQEIHTAHGGIYMSPFYLQFQNHLLTLFLNIGGKEKSKVDYKNLGFMVHENAFPILDFGYVYQLFSVSAKELQEKYSFSGFKEFELHQTIKNYVHFLSRAKKLYLENHIDDSFLNYIIALDLLLGDENELAKSVTLRTSVLTHKQFNNTYHQQKEKIKKLYKSRSKYVHEGKSVEENELNEIVEIVDEIFKCLMRLQNIKDAKEKKFRGKWIKELDFLASSAETDRDISEENFTKVGVKF